MALTRKTGLHHRWPSRRELAQQVTAVLVAEYTEGRGDMDGIEFARTRQTTTC